jgi:hypothetical protein
LKSYVDIGLFTDYTIRIDSRRPLSEYEQAVMSKDMEPAAYVNLLVTNMKNFGQLGGSKFDAINYQNVCSRYC